MPNWNSPLELNRDAIIFAKLSSVWTGLYCWEIVTSMQLERDVILGRRKFHWPLAPYLICRYSPIIALLCLACSQSSTRCVYYTPSSTNNGSGPDDGHDPRPINCAVTYVIAFCFELSVTSASVIFALRTIAMWTNRVVTGCLCGLVAVDTLLVLLTTIQNRSKWDSVRGCMFLHPDLTYLTAMVFRIFTMAFDALILSLIFYKLGAGISWKGRTSVVRFLFRQGLMYFIFAFLCNGIAAGFLIWKPNFQLGIIAVPPASFFTAIAACRSVRYLDVFIARDNKEIFHPNATATGPVELDTIPSMEEQDRSRVVIRTR
ncbi:hypothetical protein CPB83DRAFT_906389 [Crepidotus variabilis]|uniref:Uncharacterized protein n=1 Tax=Crepidotus variabilis TaxID=179855 RepID=A0A9P6EGJ0_9AGAR|nr:hypothetical protein CPB83DRAFT_906389 [Crepidotus variabilis]